MTDSGRPANACTQELRLSLFAALDAMDADERGARSPRSVTDWLLESAPEGLVEARRLLSPESAADIEPHLAVVEATQELARRLFYIGRVHATDRELDWDTRLLWDFVSATSRDLYETSRAVVAMAAQGLDTPAKVLLRHAMEIYGRVLVVLRDPEEQRVYLHELQQLRDFQMREDEESAESEYRLVGKVGGALMDRVAVIEQNLDESSLPSREQATYTAELLRDLYGYFSNITHGGPPMVDEVLYVYDPSFPSRQRKRAWGFGKPTADGRLVIAYLTMQLWQFWRMVPRALERSGMAEVAEGDAGILLVAARGLERAVVQCFGTRVFLEVGASRD